jgi:hypothetical protein
MIETVFVVVFVLVGDSSLPFEAASMSASSTVPTESIELSISNEDNSQMTDESPGVVVEVPPPPQKSMHCYKRVSPLQTVVPTKGSSVSDNSSGPFTKQTRLVTPSNTSVDNSFE